MSIYTITPDFFKNIQEDERNYFSNILFVFTNKTNNYKVSKDVNGEILNIYRDIEENGEVIKTWLDLMSFTPSSFEKINIDISSIDCYDTKFIKLCKETIGYNNLIVYSIQNISKFKCEEKKINFEETTINIFDRDDASIELNQNQNEIINIIKSQVALGGSTIKKSRNKQ
jgi:hypothetical protein